MNEFRRLTQTELDRLDDDQLVAYVAAARQMRDVEAAREAAGILAFRHWPRVRGMVAVKTPPRFVEDVAMEVMTSAVKSAFDGIAVGQFISFLRVITARRIADFHASRDPDQDQLPSEHAGDDEVWGEEPSVEDDSAVFAINDLIQRTLSTRSELHRRIIELKGPDAIPGFGQLPSRQVVERIASELGERISEGNVDQIWSRFKKDLDSALREDAGGAHD